MCEHDFLESMYIHTMQIPPMTARHYFEGQICNKQSNPRHSEIEVV